MIGAVLKLIIFTSVVNRIINTSRQERVTVNNYMFRPKAAIFRLSQLLFCSNSVIYRVYQNDWSGIEADYIHKCGEQNYKY